MTLINNISAQLFDEILNIHLPRWEELPAFPVYNEQMVTLVESSLSPLFIEADLPITKSMINNYVKWEMLPKPVNKKYEREHIVRTMVITALKQVLPINQISRGIDLQLRLMDWKAAYNQFCDCLEGTLKGVIGPLTETHTTCEWREAAIDVENVSMVAACRSLAYNIVAQLVLHLDQNR